MLTVKVKDGTPIHGNSLCDSCTWSLMIRGFRENDKIAFCTYVNPTVRVLFPVRECSGHCNKNEPTKYDMEKIAWILLTKRIDRKVGFVKSDDFRRIFGEDAEITP